MCPILACHHMASSVSAVLTSSSSPGRMSSPRIDAASLECRVMRLILRRVGDAEDISEGMAWSLASRTPCLHGMMQWKRARSPVMCAVMPLSMITPWCAGRLVQGTVYNRMLNQLDCKHVFVVVFLIFICIVVLFVPVWSAATPTVYCVPTVSAASSTFTVSGAATSVASAQLGCRRLLGHVLTGGRFPATRHLVCRGISQLQLWRWRSRNL
ncbi:hypothetical protein H257_11100 [Aphanomyces astaci]|uniref:Uncharacterized protein n=1 Tax=Aphanomyces astaci TaxID=112090 RepID=W4G383_APHAT|nr:hypothetical protein H257_11100 [Aphanomyces astaci]ETV74135.1 hypothetical protein H257_11100 [Aphanomyces astaci]|eukprot:XP_009836241.1 hypothetical protein H257_11100 [Aphanomyces astaci]